MTTIAFAGNRIHPNLVAIGPLITQFLNELHKVTDGITMLNGLADGADMETAEAFYNWQPEQHCVKKSIAIIPFAADDYEQAINQKQLYRDLLIKSDETIALHSVYATSNFTHTPAEAILINNKAYQLQALHMLHHCNMLLAAADTTATGKPGGTLETIAIAQKMGLPVVLIDLGKQMEEMKVKLLPMESGGRLYKILEQVVNYG